MAKTKDEIVRDMKEHHLKIKTYKNLIEQARCEAKHNPDNDFDLRFIKGAKEQMYFHAKAILELKKELDQVAPNDWDFHFGGRAGNGQYFYLVGDAESIIDNYEREKQPGNQG